MAAWKVGEHAAQNRLAEFLKSDVHAYDQSRDLPGVPGTSCLSPHLHFGEISARQVLFKLIQGGRTGGGSIDCLDEGQTTFAKELVWRDFAHSLLYHFPHAGMRQLYATGWMHNRVRMIVGSYLVKNLLIPWQAGEAWFQDTLVDADLASNSMGWQWVSGCGAISCNGKILA